MAVHTQRKANRSLLLYGLRKTEDLVICLNVGYYIYSYMVKQVGNIQLTTKLLAFTEHQEVHQKLETKAKVTVHHFIKIGGSLD